MKILTYRDLRERGVRYSKPHLNRLIKQGRFPRPMKGFGRGNSWPEPVIDDHVRRLVERQAEHE
jgi:predicted DNA-binding transcriptional regulator AlpA